LNRRINPDSILVMCLMTVAVEISPLPPSPPHRSGRESLHCHD
jgi:hypothetical protein